ncbi:hypothetical protein BGZ60DRAFT_557071 [Tricladium varicosporioides]|nr:hypothetical protein BGZ60DRAFT_557071 [Hymenoscyphus varicosporioides]
MPLFGNLVRPLPPVPSLKAGTMTQSIRVQKPLISNQAQRTTEAHNHSKELPPLPPSPSSRGMKTRSHKSEPKPKVKLRSNGERALQNSFPYRISRPTLKSGLFHTTKATAVALANTSASLNVNSEGEHQPCKRKYHSSRNYVRQLIQKKDEIFEAGSRSRRKTDDKIDKPLIEAWMQETWDASHHFRPGSEWSSVQGDYTSDCVWSEQLDEPCYSSSVSLFIESKRIYLNSDREALQEREHAGPVIQECPGSPEIACEYSSWDSDFYLNRNHARQTPTQLCSLGRQFQSLDLTCPESCMHNPYQASLTLSDNGVSSAIPTLPFCSPPSKLYTKCPIRDGFNYQSLEFIFEGFGNFVDVVPLELRNTASNPKDKLHDTDFEDSVDRWGLPPIGKILGEEEDVGPQQGMDCPHKAKPCREYDHHL